jgi:hypothetical protein
MSNRPQWMPQARQFSQADPRVEQRPEGLDSNDFPVEITDIRSGRVLKYADVQASPGRWDEHWAQTTQPVQNAGARITLVEKDLGFICNSFCCDNWTNQWLYEENLKRYIMPYSGGWILPAPNGYQMARVTLKVPSTAFTLQAAIVGETVWMGWHEAFLPPATGISTLTKNAVTA